MAARVCETRMTAVLKTRPIKCPVCNKGKIIDVLKDIPYLSIRVYPPLLCDSAKYFVKCPKCGEQIGISIKQ